MKRKRTAEEEELLSVALAMVRRLAAHLGSRHPSVPMSDLESAGNEALAVFFDAYNPEQGPFEPTAFLYVRWAMLGTIRRTMRTLKRETPASDHLRPVVEDEHASDADRLAAFMTSDQASDRRALVRDLGLQAASFTAAQLHAGAGGEDDVVEQHHLARGAAALRQAAVELDDRERLVYRHWIQEERKLEEIAKLIDVDPRTVQRIGDRIRRKLAEKLAPLVA